MKKILFVAQNLQIGGVQRALINMLDYLSSKDDDISLFVFGDGPLQREIPSKIKIFYGSRLLRLVATPFQVVVKSKKPIDIFLRCILMVLVRLIGSEKMYAWLLRKHQQDVTFDIAISYFTDIPNNYFNQGTTQYVSDYVRAEQKAAWIHTDPILSNFDRDTCLYRFCNMDHIVCVSEAVRQKMEQLLPEYSQKMSVFYNCFNIEKIRNLANAYAVSYLDDVYNIVTVARIDDYSKRIHGIVRLCAQLKTEGVTNFHWYIVGEGSDLVKNQKEADKLGLNDVLTFCGAVQNPYPYIQNADLFALYSAYEGYPMVIGETIVLNTPILTTNYAAAKEQIPSDKGIIAMDDNEFYRILKEIIIKDV